MCNAGFINLRAQSTCMRTIVTIAAAFLISINSIGQKMQAVIDPKSLPQLSPHYTEEYTFDKSTDEAAWNAVPKGLNAALGSPDQLYFRRDVPHIQQTNNEVVAWKGERVNLQILTWSPDTLEQVRVR